MAGRIRRGTVWINGAQQFDAANLKWQDKFEFDRSQVDDKSWGPPVKMGEGPGTGSFDLLAGTPPASGYAAGTMVFKYKVINVNGAAETPTEKTATFTDVTFNGGGDVPIGAAGRLPVNFEYNTCTLA